MSTQTNIEWTDITWNPVTGCDKVSPGCAHCYAESIALRFWHKTEPPILESETVRPRRFSDVQFHPDRLDQPLHWRKPRRVFVNSMSDLFHEDVPDAFIDRVFAVMSEARQHTFQVLTKRPDRMLSWAMSRPRDTVYPEMAVVECTPPIPASEKGPAIGALHARIEWPLPNVWLGVSCENQHFLDERVPLLLQTPAAVRFISAEPLLEGLDIAKHRPGANRLWVIVGGESGPHARPCHVSWIQSIVGQCQGAGVPVFVKQLGSCPLAAYGRVELHSKKGSDMAEWPEDLRVREWPQCNQLTH